MTSFIGYSILARVTVAALAEYIHVLHYFVGATSRGKLKDQNFSCTTSF